MLFAPEHLWGRRYHVRSDSTLRRTRAAFRALNNAKRKYGIVLFALFSRLLLKVGESPELQEQCNSDKIYDTPLGDPRMHQISRNELRIHIHSATPRKIGLIYFC